MPNMSNEKTAQVNEDIDKRWELFKERENKLTIFVLRFGGITFVIALLWSIVEYFFIR